MQSAEVLKWPLPVEVVQIPITDAQARIAHAFDLILKAAARAPKS